MEKQKKQITSGFLALSFLVIIFWEYVFYLISLRNGFQGIFLYEIRLTFFLRAIESIFLVICAFLFSGIENIGLDLKKIKQGFVKGVVWSACFGILAFSLIFIFWLSGFNVLRFFRIDYVKTPAEIFWFYAAAGLSGPVAEEIFFRGILFGYLRRYGVIIAAVSSTLFFVLAHSTGGIPFTQIIGGLLFCYFYEKTDSLLAPLIIHITGNMAMFTLGLFHKIL